MVATYDAFGCTYSRKISQCWVFIGSLLEMPKTNYFDRDEYRTFIVQFPCRKMKTFLFAQIVSKKIASNEASEWGILYLFFCSGHSCSQLLNPSIDNLSYLFQSLDKQSFLSKFLCFSSRILLQTQHKPSFLLVLIPTQTIFPTCVNSSIDNHASASFHLSVFIPVKITSRYMTTNFCSLFM